MPAPAVYIVAAVVGTAAVSAAFYQFVYEPHIAPKIEAWAEDFLERRAAKRRQQAKGRVPVPASVVHDDDDRGSQRKKDDAYELENLISEEVEGWRSAVGQSPRSTLRHRTARKTTSAQSELNELNASAAFRPITPDMTPTHVVFDSSCPPTPSTSRSSAFNSVRMPTARLPTPEPSLRDLPLSPEPSTVNEIRNPPSNATIDPSVLSPRCNSPFSLVYASSTPSPPRSPTYERGLLGRENDTNTDMFMSAIESPHSRFITPLEVPTAANTDALSELEFLSASSVVSNSDSDSDMGDNPFLDHSSSSSHGSNEDDFDIRSTSSWASARAT